MARLAIIGFGYQYWVGTYENSAQTSEADLRKANAASSGTDAGSLCAEKNGLYKRDGNWHRRRD